MRGEHSNVGLGPQSDLVGTAKSTSRTLDALLAKPWLESVTVQGGA